MCSGDYEVTYKRFSFFKHALLFECHKLLQAITERGLDPVNSLVDNTFSFVPVNTAEQFKCLKLLSEVELAYGQEQHPNHDFLIFTQG